MCSVYNICKLHFLFAGNFETCGSLLLLRMFCRCGFPENLMQFHLTDVQLYEAIKSIALIKKHSSIFDFKSIFINIGNCHCHDNSWGTFIGKRHSKHVHVISYLNISCADMDYCQTSLKRRQSGVAQEEEVKEEARRVMTAIQIQTEMSSPGSCAQMEMILLGCKYRMKLATAFVRSDNAYCMLSAGPALWYHLIRMFIFNEHL